MSKNFHYIILFIFEALVLSNATPIQEHEFKIEAYKKDGDSQILVLRIQGNDNAPYPSHRQARQEEDDDSRPPSTTPFIPAVIPALTKIFTGIITGNLNEIFHGSTSFAPQNVSYAIDTVYNQVVGLAPPVSTPATTRRSLLQRATEPVTEPPATTAAPSVAAGEPLSQSVVVTSTAAPITTSKAASNEDDEDENDVDQRRRDNAGVKVY